ncbi:MAG: NAD(P) transhydrogenase subunit alpha [Gammaproteobacteria bacterium]|nr:NAD(P) transhydrogenase subunit alpha [Gammaproteobacteria bacterium]
MRIVTTKETWPGEKRVALVPQTVQKLTEQGFDVTVQNGCGEEAGFTDAAYESAGATLTEYADEALRYADIVLAVRPPSPEVISWFPDGSTYLGFLDPFRFEDTVVAFANCKVDAISLDMVPRSTRAQKLDGLSSQASLAGYAAIVVAAFHLPRIFPLMMTPAGTLSPAKVFVIGAGVAGLQAIATAHRLGARIEAFDTRPVVKEEVQSLGARFLEIDLGELGQTEQGYAQELTAEQQELQRQGMAAAIARSDIVITTAQVFGRPAPKIVSFDMVEAMQPTSVVIDMAVETGGNVEGSKLDEIVDIDGVKLIGMGSLPSQVAGHASEMYSSNLFEYLNEFKCEDPGQVDLNVDDEILEASVVVRDGEVVNERLKEMF